MSKQNFSSSKTLTYSSFVIACLFVVVAFVTATTYIQLGIAILLYPLLAFFAYKIIPRKSKIGFDSFQAVTPEKLETGKEKSMGIADIDKRVFLKLIAGSGLVVFILSLLNKRGENLLFKSLPPSGASGKVSLEDLSGNKIDPAQNQPMDGYRIAEVDDNVITFYGFTNKDGAWVVMKEDTDTGSFRYSQGDTNFPGSWTNRENLKYDYFNKVF